jgi:hypothetical protein
MYPYLHRMLHPHLQFQGFYCVGLFGLFRNTARFDLRIEGHPLYWLVLSLADTAYYYRR